MDTQASPTKGQVDDIDIPVQVPADFEAAIEASGFGRFNFLLLFVALLAAMGFVFETSTVSYILPSAECDLQLTLLDKGVLNAITYAGMITSAIAWGYVADTKGRKFILVIGLLLVGLSDFGAATSQGVMQLMIFKYLGGLSCCGPFAVLMSYLSEMHGKRVRSFIMMITGTMFSTSAVVLPTLATAILPKDWSFRISYFTFSSWHVFLCISALPSFLSGFLLICFPESPKFLMSQGRNREALEIFQMIYATNTGKSRESYPIRLLAQEAIGRTNDTKIISKGVTVYEGSERFQRKQKVTLHDGILQLRPLFHKPYLRLSLQVYCTNTLVLLGQNTMRLWLPQLFASIAEFQNLTGGVSSMCDIVEFGVNKTIAMKINPNNTACEVIITPLTYINNILVGGANFTGYIIVSMVINRIGTKRVLLLATLIAGSCGMTLYLSNSLLTTLIFAALYTTTGSIASTSLISCSVSLFPTSLRTMIVSLTMMFGRSGSLIGNVLFPIFMELGCLQPFLLVSTVMFLAFCLSSFLPSTNKIALK